MLAEIFMLKIENGIRQAVQRDERFVPITLPRPVREQTRAKRLDRAGLNRSLAAFDCVS